MKGRTGILTEENQIRHSVAILAALRSVRKKIASGKSTEAMKMVDQMIESESKTLDRMMGFQKGERE
ncbi:hypothetical protein [Faecalibaculum rodentium]|uniref:hypothetical protein n=1 Tax=Faecalibaculum rodentium TaxID=1702221 RepID=UPI00273167F0|nr:hypothetical protein [Faecalibaculum rodentium]